VDNLYAKLNVNVYLLLSNRLKFLQISSNPVAVLFYGFSKAAWEL
jgi:hypothetical protein